MKQLPKNALALLQARKRDINTIRMGRRDAMLDVRVVSGQDWFQSVANTVIRRE